MKKFRIARVKLTNITSHSNTTINLPRHGSIALIGPNGAGKSSIVEAIYTALTLSSLRIGGKGKGYELVRHGQTTGEIQVLLEANGETIEATVRLDKHRKRKEVRIKHNGKILATTDTAYKKTITRLLGLPHNTKLEVLQSTAIIPQGTLRDIAETMGKPREFRELVEKAMGIPDYKNALKKLKDLVLEYEGEYAPIPAVNSKDPRRPLQSIKVRRLVEKIEKTINNINEKEEQIRRAKEMKEEAEGKLKEIIKNIEEIENKRKQIIEEITLHQKQLQKLEEYQQKILKNKRDLDNLQLELEKIREAEQKLPQVRKIAQLVEDYTELKDVENRIEQLKHQLDEYERIMKALETAKNTKPLANKYDEVVEALNENEKLLAQLNVKISEIREKINNIIINKEKIEKIAGKLAHETGIPTTSIINNPSKVEEKLGELEEKLQETREKIEENSRQLAMTASQRIEAEKAYEALLKSTKPRCPVCGAPLTTSKIQELRLEFKNKITQLKNTEARLRKDIQYYKKEEKDINSKIKRVEKLLGELKTLIEIGGIKQLPGLQEEISKLEKEKQTIKTNIKTLEQEATSLEKQKQAYSRAIAILETHGYTLENEKEIKTKYNRHKEKIKELTNKYEEKKKRILTITGTRNIEEAKKKILEASRQLGKYEQLVSRKEKVTGEIEEKRRELEELQSELEELEKTKEKITILKEKLGEIEENLRSQIKLKESLISQIGSLNKEIENAELSKRESEAKLKTLKTLRDRLYTSIIAGAIVVDVQEKLIQGARASLENAMSMFLDKFGLEYHAVEIMDVGDGFEVNVLSREKRGGTPVQLLSGGEKTALALAYILALQHNLALRTGFLILDEPTSELDEDRREVLMNILQEISGDQQLIIVTHHENVIDKVDEVCTVKKTGGVSTVKCGET